MSRNLSANDSNKNDNENDNASHRHLPPPTPSTSTSTLRPPVGPKSSAFKGQRLVDDLASVGGGGRSGSGNDVYIRKDGKLVRRVKKRNSGADSVVSSGGSSYASASSYASFDSNDDFSIASQDVYYRADGKKVRRVKKKKNKTPATAEQVVVAANSQLPVASMAPSRQPEPVAVPQQPPVPAAATREVPADEEPKPYSASAARSMPVADHEPYSAPAPTAPVAKEPVPDNEPLPPAEKSMEEDEPISVPPPFVDEEPEPVISFESDDRGSKADQKGLPMNPYEAYLLSSSVDSDQMKPNLDRVLSSDAEPEPCVSMTYTQDSEMDVRPTYSAEQYMKLAYSVSGDPSVDFEELEQRNNAKQLATSNPDPALLAASLKAVASISQPTAPTVVTETSDNPWLLDPVLSGETPTPTMARFDHFTEFSSTQSPDVAVQPQHQLGARPPYADQPKVLQKAPTEDDVVRALSGAAYVALASTAGTGAASKTPMSVNLAAREPVSPLDSPAKPATGATEKQQISVRDPSKEAARERASKKRGYIPPQISTDPSQSYTTSYTGGSTEGGDSMTQSPESRRVATSYTSDSQTQSSPSRRGTQSYTSASESHDSESSRPSLNVQEALSARTRSRMADMTGPGNMNPYDPRTGAPMHRINEDDGAFIITTSLARKRVRVVQLLCVGLLGLLFGFLGSFYVQSSCHFISAQVDVGQNEKTFELHYGMWKYTPLESAFQDYAYCTGYDSQYTYDAPFIPRVAGITALLLGGYSMTILWVYLIFGKASRRTWMGAVIVCALAGIFQGLTLMFYTGHVCQRDACTLGPGAVISALSAVFWIISSFEMYYNTPVTKLEMYVPGSGNLVSTLEVADFEDAGYAYIQRIHDKGETGTLPSLNQIQRNNSAPLGEGVLELSSVRSPMNGSYKPPPGHFV